MGERLQEPVLTAKWPPTQERRPAVPDVEKRTKEVADGER